MNCQNNLSLWEIEHDPILFTKIQKYDQKNHVERHIVEDIQWILNVSSTQRDWVW